EAMNGESNRAWFIPAGAGNTIKVLRQESIQTVYPRWRGEHSKSTQLNLKPFLAYKKSTNFSLFLKISNLLICNRQKRHQSQSIKIYRNTSVFTKSLKLKT
ncbi:hypothetical protein DSN25_19985, partial [Salmonella enterica subsp. salamae]|nr:hypothetical protein [Salmonella enterica subsp. salamae]ECJ4596669.1 hypothetical protein [Salmonella enterica subsp. salamae]